MDLKEKHKKIQEVKSKSWWIISTEQAKKMVESNEKNKQLAIKYNLPEKLDYNEEYQTSIEGFTIEISFDYSELYPDFSGYIDNKKHDKFLSLCVGRDKWYISDNYMNDSKDCIRYAYEDYKRLKEYNKGYWSYLDCKIECWLNDTKLSTEYETFESDYTLQLIDIFHSIKNVIYEAKEKLKDIIENSKGIKLND